MIEGLRMIDGDLSKDVTDVEVAGDYRLLLTFEGSEQREVDLGSFLSFTGVFEPLKDPAYFRRVRVEPDVGRIVWPSGADVCPDVLYKKSRPVAAAGASSQGFRRKS